MAANETSFGVQALVTRHYFNGAYYPIGSAKAFADALLPAIEQGGGEIRLRAKVRRLLVENGAVVGVELDDATRIRAPRVFSDAGARNTVDMLPVNLRESEWAHEILSFAPSPCHVALYLGLEGDIRANGATGEAVIASSICSRLRAIEYPRENVGRRALRGGAEGFVGIGGGGLKLRS